MLVLEHQWVHYPAFRRLQKSTVSGRAAKSRGIRTAVCLPSEREARLHPKWIGSTAARLSQCGSVLAAQSAGMRSAGFGDALYQQSHFASPLLVTVPGAVIRTGSRKRIISKLLEHETANNFTARAPIDFRPPPSSSGENPHRRTSGSCSALARF
jgi:hypothetical protein